MEPNHFLEIDDQHISLQQAIQYLKMSGRLQLFIGEILRHYFLEQELNSAPSLDVSPDVVQQAIIEFRLEQQLTDPNHFQEWLASTGLDYSTFYNQILNSFKLEKLKAQITEPKLQEHFIERKVFLDQVVLSRITVKDKELAEELYSQLQEGARFEELAQNYSLTDERVANGMMGPVSRGSLPDKLRAIVDSVDSNEVIEPLEIEENWCLFRVEKVLPASLESPLKQQLQNQLFEQWLLTKMQQAKVRLQVN